MFELKCQGCGVIGELEEPMDEFDCPQCGAIMLPVNNNASEKKEVEEDDDTPTIAISKSAIQDYKNIKVAKAVDVGFGGMFGPNGLSGTIPKVPIVSKMAEREKPQLGKRPNVSEQEAHSSQIIPPQETKQSVDSKKKGKKFSIGKKKVEVNESMSKSKPSIPKKKTLIKAKGRGRKS